MASGAAGVVRPASIDEARELVRALASVVPRGAGTKWGLADPGDGAVVLETGGLSGVTEYDPDEFTFTALAGTPVAEVERLLAEHRQYLPFDPPFVEAGATLGGVVASAIAGPCRLRFGGVRDFILGVRFVDGRGEVVRGGGRVVKNAAGFDLPKFLCGSRGKMGLIVEVTFKVFPRPEAFATVAIGFEELGPAARAARALLRSPLEPHAVELAAGSTWSAVAGSLPGRPAQASSAPAWVLAVRVGGPETALGGWLGRVEGWVGRHGERLQGQAEAGLWRRLRDLAWVHPGAAVVRVHARPSQVEELDGVLAREGAGRHYSLGGHVAWAHFDTEPDWDSLARRLGAMGAAAVVLRGAPPSRVWLVGIAGAGFWARAKAALDPQGRFGA